MPVNIMPDNESIVSSEEKKEWTINDFRGLENTPENRKNFSECPFTDLYMIEREAVDKKEYEVAALIRDIIKDRKNQKMEVNDGVYNYNLAEALQESDENRAQLKGECIDLFKTQLVVASMLSDFIGDADNTYIDYEQLIIDIRDDSGKKVPVTLENLDKDKNQATIIVSGSSLGGSEDVSFFVLKEGEFEEISVLSDRNSIDLKEGEFEESSVLSDRNSIGTGIKNIEQVGDFYRVTIRSLDRMGLQIQGTDLSFIVDYNGDYVEELGPQSGNESFMLIENNGSSSIGSFGCYEYSKNLDDGKKSYRIFNSNMEILAEYDSDWSLEYCNDNVCICFSRGSGETQEYKVFYKNEIVGEGFVNELENDLQGNNLTADYLYECRKKLDQKLVSEKEEKYNCRVFYDAGNKLLSIKNRGGDLLWNQEGVDEYDGNYYLTKEGKNYRIQLNNNMNESNLLLIEIINVDDADDITNFIINKKTGKEFSDLDLTNLKSEINFYVRGNLLIIDCDDMITRSVYSDNFDYLGYTGSGNLDMLWVGKDGKFYVVDSKTGEILSEFLWIDSESFDFKDGNVWYDPSSKFISNDDGSSLLEYRIDEDRRLFVCMKKDNKVIAQYECDPERKCKNDQRNYVFKYQAKNGDYYFVVLTPDKGLVQVKP